LRTRAIPERFCGGVSLRRGAVSSVCTFTYTFRSSLLFWGVFLSDPLSFLLLPSVRVLTWTTIRSFHGTHNVVDRIAVCYRRRGRNLRAKLDTAINSLSANHAYLRTLYGRFFHTCFVFIFRLSKCEGWRRGGHGARLAINKSRVSTPGLCAFTHVPLLPSSIIWYRLKCGGAMPLRRSAVALAMRRRQ